MSSNPGMGNWTKGIYLKSLWYIESRKPFVDSPGRDETALSRVAAWWNDHQILNILLYHDRDFLACMSTLGLSLSSSGSHFLFYLNISDYMKFDILIWPCSQKLLYFLCERVWGRQTCQKSLRDSSWRRTTPILYYLLTLYRAEYNIGNRTQNNFVSLIFLLIFSFCKHHHCELFLPLECLEYNAGHVEICNLVFELLNLLEEKEGYVQKVKIFLYFIRPLRHKKLDNIEQSMP